MSDKTHKSDADWRAELSEEQFFVCRQQGTERAFSGKYHDCKEAGIYVCSCCAQPLFDSDSKFDSGSGWPSFYQPLKPEVVAQQHDHSHGMQRIEVHCNKCGAHLGHVFADGPQPTGLRYCINSISLDLKTE